MKPKYTDQNGVIHWRTDQEYTLEELRKQRDDFEAEAKSGKVICLSDLIINHEKKVK